MPLTSWKNEPEHYRLAAVLSGGDHDLEGFLDQWLMHRGDLDIPAAWLDSNGSRGRGLVLYPGRLPSHAILIQWLLTQDSWLVFYQRSRNGEDPKPTVSGIFTQWGFDENPAQQSHSHPVAVTKDQQVIRLPGETSNLIDLLSGKSHLDLKLPPLRHPVVMPAATPADDPVANSTLTLRLIDDMSHRLEPNLHHDLARIKSRIRQLQQYQEKLEWQTLEYAPPVEMYAYIETIRETPGSGTQWDLRYWFVGAPDRDVDAFQYCRVAIEGHGVLHLVLPKDLDHAPVVQPENPHARLRLDPYWRKRRRYLFAPSGKRLYPEPPPGHERVTALFEKALWEGSDPSKDILFLLRDERASNTQQGWNDEQGGYIRVAIPHSNFKPLAESMEELNYTVAHEMQQREPVKHVLQEVLERQSTLLKAKLQEHVAAIRGTLGLIWTGERADVNVQRSQIGKATGIIASINKELADLGARRDKARDVGRKDLQDWKEFVALVNSLDRELSK